MKKTNSRPKIRKGAWFYPVRGSYLPCSWQGWLVEAAIVVLFFAFLQRSFMHVFYLGGDDMISVVLSEVCFVALFTVSLGVLATWVAKQKS